jgi:hypothetical protein
MMGPAGRLWWPAGPSSGWVGGKAKLCMVQAAYTNNMAGFLTVCSAKGNAAHQCAFCLSKAKTIGPRVYDPTTFNPET